MKKLLTAAGFMLAILVGSYLLGFGLDIASSYLGEWAKTAGLIAFVVFVGWRIADVQSGDKETRRELDRLEAGVKSLTAENDALRRQLLRAAGDRP